MPAPMSRGSRTMQDTWAAPTTRAVWISVMGGPHVKIDVHYDYAARVVLVTDATLATMARTFREAGIFDDATSAETANAILAAPRLDGLADVTELGGGWDQWQDMIVEPAR